MSNSSSGSANATESPPPPCEGAGNAGTPVTGTYHTRVPSRPYVHQDHLTSASQFGARAPPLAIQNRSTPSARTRSDVHPSLSSEPRSISERVPPTRSTMKCAGTGGGDGVGGSPRPSAPDRGEPLFASADACARIAAGLVESGRGGIAGRRASSLTLPVTFASRRVTRRTGRTRAMPPPRGPVISPMRATSKTTTSRFPESVGVATRRNLPNALIATGSVASSCSNSTDVTLRWFLGYMRRTCRSASVSFDEPPQSNQDPPPPPPVPRNRAHTAITPPSSHANAVATNSLSWLTSPKNLHLPVLKSCRTKPRDPAAARSRPSALSATSLRGQFGAAYASGSITCRAARSSSSPPVTTITLSAALSRCARAPRRVDASR